MARSRLGPLALESRLGSDPAHSSVWRAVHVELRRSLAVKVFHVPFGGTPEARREFAREWETLKRLRHGSIARCYGGGFEDNDAYLAYEIVDGESLEERVARRQRLPWETVLDEAEPLVEALEHAHNRQIVHGGLVPDKIRLAGLVPAILDFRVERFTSIYRSQRPPTAFELAFRAPEVIEDPRRTTAKSDLYSLGALLFYALSGRPPIEGQTPDEVAEAASTVVPPKVASLVLDCPIWLSSLIEQLLEKNPASRPHGAAAVALALREVRRRSAAGTGVAEHTSAGFSPIKLNTDKAEARALLGHLEQDDDEDEPDGAPFYERAWFLITSLVALLGIIAWFLWPLNESQLRAEAEALIDQGHRAALGQAKDQYLEMMLRKYPDGEHADWAREQIEQIEMLEAERVLELKLSRGAKLTSEGERLFAAARRYEQFGDTATALDTYESLITLLAEREEHRAFVNLARRQIATIRARGTSADERQRIVSEKLAEADALARNGDTIEARKIWYSIIELYGDNREMTPLVATAQDRLARMGVPSNTNADDADD